MPRAARNRTRRTGCPNPSPKAVAFTSNYLGAAGRPHAPGWAGPFPISSKLIGEKGAVTLLDAFEGRRMLIAYYYMWFDGELAPEQCEGCTFFTTQVRELSHIHSRDVTYATFCQGSHEESVRYRKFMGWEMPWYSVPETSLEALLAGRRPGIMYLICYLRQGSDVFETYWTTRRGVEAMDNSYRLLDLTVYGRQEDFEDSPAGWPQYWGETNHPFRRDGRPISQWRRLEEGHSDDLGGGHAGTGRSGHACCSGSG